MADVERELCRIPEVRAHGEIGLDTIAYPLWRDRIELEGRVLVEQVRLGGALRVDMARARVDEPPDRWMARACEHELARDIDVRGVDARPARHRAPQWAVDHGIDAAQPAGAPQ